MKGDIIPPDNWKYFNCEAKNYADFPFHQLIQDECKQLETWLSQLMDVSDPDDLNILIFKITRKGKYVAVQNNIDWDHSSPYIYYKSSTHNDWKIFDYDNFLEYNASLIEYISTLGITGYIHLKYLLILLSYISKDLASIFFQHTLLKIVEILFYQNSSLD